MFVGGGEGGWIDAFCVRVELGDWASEKLSGRVQLEGHSPKWRALRNFSFQPCMRVFFFSAYSDFSLFIMQCSHIKIEDLDYISYASPPGFSL